MLRRFGEAPPLGSDKDIVLRQYIERETLKESLQTRVLVLSSLGLSNNEGLQQFNSAYRKYLNILFFKDFELSEEEDKMRQELDEILATQPKLVVNKDGSLSVRDLNKKTGKKPEKPAAPRRRR